MTYVTAVVKEVLRIHPPTDLSFREVTAQEVHVGPYCLRKGELVMLHYPSIHTAAFTAPEVFDPDRFFPHSDTYTTIYSHDDRKTFCPFSGGSRSCVGMKVPSVYPYTQADMIT